MPRGNILLFALFALLIIVGAVAGFILSGWDSPDETAPPVPGSFSFFDLDSNSRLDRKLRDALSIRLGSDAIETRTTVNLETNYRGFLAEHFPELHHLNQRFNYEPNVRIEHDTVRLTYRFARKKNVPFGFISLLFSNRTGRPLLFEIRPDVAAPVLNSLKDKYGEPETVVWGEGKSRSLVWAINGDVLLFTERPDRYGKPEYQIQIYFVNNMIPLLEEEESAREAEAQKKKQTGGSAF